MSVSKLLILMLTVGLSGCSSNPNYGKAAHCGSIVPLCLAAVAIEDLTTKDRNTSQKCSDMAGEERKACYAQLESVKKHLRVRLNNRYNSNKKIEN